MKKSKISFVIIAHNEEQNIVSCLESISWADEIILVDCESTDQTVKLAKKYTEKIFLRKNIPNLNINKSFGIKQATNEWIFYIDPDERITPELAEQIKKIILQNDGYNGYIFPRKNYYFGKWLKHGGKYPDRQLRLFRRNKGYFACKHVHERLIVEGKYGKLNYPILHCTYKTVDEFLKKYCFYTSFQAGYLKQEGMRPNLKNFLLYFFILPLKRFTDRYFIKLGILDGVTGLFACIFESLFFVVSYMKFLGLHSFRKLR